MPAHAIAIATAMTVRALPISPPTLTLPAAATVAEALALMVQRKVNHLPVCSAEGRFLALVSSNAILHALLPASARVEHGVEGLDFAGDALPMLLAHLGELAARPALDLADPEAVPVTPDTPLLEAARRLTRTSSPLPVVAGDGQLLGMLSRRLLLTHLLGQAGRN